MPRASSNPSLADYLTVGEAAEFLGVSPWTLRNWDRAGKLKPMRHPKNGYRIYRHQDLNAILKPIDAHCQTDHTLTPQVNIKAMDEEGHFVQFYENDEFLIESVSDFMEAAVAGGVGSLVIGTRDHREGIERLLRSRGLDIPAAAAAGRYVALDAGQTLSRIMVDGLPDPGKFAAVVGGTLARVQTRMQKGRRTLRAFGEMVALLWVQGNRTAAIRLEELWNDLAQTHSLSLLCAYPISGFRGEDSETSLEHVCTHHSKVIPAESYAGLQTADERMRAITRLQQKALSLEAEIAHRKEAEKLLLRRDRELFDFFENAIEGLHQVGPDGNIIWANKAELSLLGYQPQEYIGHHIAEFHADRPVIDDMLAKLLRGDTLRDYPARLRCKDGSIKHVLISSNAYFEDGKFVHTRCFTRDVTEKLNAELRQQDLLDSERAARAQAERISRMKDEFLATLSHELRTPLNAIYGWSQIIKQSPAHAETVSEGITIIDRNVRMQTQLIEDLLDMSRIISGKVRLDVQRVELIPVLQAAAEAVRPAADAKGIQIKQVLDPLAGPVSGDPSRLQQVLWNLLTNALKFTPKGGKVELLLERVNSHVEITVSDTGQGIAPEFLPHVFERFRQADSSSTRKFGGLGIGLSIVKQLVELHGGTVRAKSAGEGKGSTFSILLPPLVTRRTEPSEHPSTASENPADCRQVSLKGIKVLVVDDEPDAGQLVARLLRDCEAKVIVASSAAQAIELLVRHKPHVLVSDIGMPGTDGYEFIRHVRSLSSPQISQVPAIALTAFARSQDRTRSMLAGYQAHISKPLEPQELIVTVASLVARARK